jgi:hypothetical protein
LFTNFTRAKYKNGGRNIVTRLRPSFEHIIRIFIRFEVKLHNKKIAFELSIEIIRYVLPLLKIVLLRLDIHSSDNIFQTLTTELTQSLLSLKIHVIVTLVPLTFTQTKLKI